MGQSKSISYNKHKECGLQRSTFEKALGFLNLSYENPKKPYKKSSFLRIIIQDGWHERVVNVKVDGHYQLIRVYVLRNYNELSSIPLLSRFDEEIKVQEAKSLLNLRSVFKIIRDKYLNVCKRKENDKISTNNESATSPKLTVHEPKKIKFCQRVSLVEYGQKESITSLNEKENSFKKRLAEKKYLDLIEVGKDTLPRKLTRKCKRRAVQRHVRKTVKRANLDLYSVEELC